MTNDDSNRDSRRPRDGRHLVHTQTRSITRRSRKHPGRGSEPLAGHSTMSAGWRMSYGPRLQGSPAMRQAADWVAKTV